MSKAVVLHSGGLDSTTLIAQAIEDGAEKVLLLSMRYGSLHMEAENQAAQAVFEWYKEAFPWVDFVREVYELPNAIFKGEGSALLGEKDMPHLTYQEINESEGPSPTVVPGRNANFICIAASIAEARGYDLVYIGAHGEDAHNWAYPDCTPEFLGAMAAAIFVSSYQKVRLVFPFIWSSKADIVGIAEVLDAPVHLSWSCYSPVTVGEPTPEGGEYVQCGKCPTCIERAMAFAQNGYVDPIGYHIAISEVIPEVATDELEEWPIDKEDFNSAEL